MLKIADVEDGDTRRELELYLASNYSVGIDNVHVHAIDVNSEDGELIIYHDEGDENKRSFPLTTPLPPKVFALMFSNEDREGSSDES